MDRDEEEEQLPTTENSPRGLHAAEPGCEVFEACGHLGLGETFVYLADISTQDSEAIWGVEALMDPAVGAQRSVRAEGSWGTRPHPAPAAGPEGKAAQRLRSGQRRCPHRGALPHRR